MQKPESVSKNEMYKILWDFKIIPARRPDLRIIYKKIKMKNNKNKTKQNKKQKQKTTCLIVDSAGTSRPQSGNQWKRKEKESSWTLSEN